MFCKCLPLVGALVSRKDIALNTVKLLITGGSGFIGTTAVCKAIDNGYIVKNFDIKKPNIESHNMFWEKIDIRDRSSFLSAMIEFAPTHILHLAAKTGMDLHSMDELTANTNGVQNLIDGANQIKNLKRVLFTSSLLVCQNGYVPQSDNEFCPPNLYGQSKMIGEQLVRKADTAFDWIIVRPTSIWGPWFEHSYKSFFQVINKGMYFHPGKDDKTKPKSFVGNTVFMMYSLLFSESAINSKKVYYLADYPQGNTREWAAEIAKQLGKEPIYTVPLGVLKIAALLGDILKKIGIEFPITSFRLNNMLTGGVYPVEKTKEIAGELPFTLDMGVKETIEWMKARNIL